MQLHHLRDNIVESTLSPSIVTRVCNHREESASKTHWSANSSRECSWVSRVMDLYAEATQKTKITMVKSWDKRGKKNVGLVDPVSFCEILYARQDEHIDVPRDKRGRAMPLRTKWWMLTFCRSSLCRRRCSRRAPSKSMSTIRLL